MAERKAVLVVGAGDATGGAIARRFAREGYVAVVTRRELASLDGLLAQIRADGGEAVGFGSDARDEDRVVALFDRIEREVAPLEAVIFNIGANVNFPIRETTSRVYRKVWEMAAFAGFLAGREAAKVMVPRGRGRIVNVASIAGKEGNPMAAAYSASKAAVIGMTKSFGKDLATSGVLVNAVAPAVIATPMLSQMSQEHIDYMVEKIPMGRLGQPEEVAELIAFLAGDRMTFSTGATFDISGGRATF
jgi:NAD(P)-dependent dehydrogenase (short-subunit alcohol dehydrogenase family)